MDQGRSIDHRIMVGTRGGVNTLAHRGVAPGAPGASLGASAVVGVWTAMRLAAGCPLARYRGRMGRVKGPARLGRLKGPPWASQRRGLGRL
jgi:hypothetical protein